MTTHKYLTLLQALESYELYMHLCHRYRLKNVFCLETKFYAEKSYKIVLLICVTVAVDIYFVGIPNYNCSNKLLLLKALFCSKLIKTD